MKIKKIFTLLIAAVLVLSLLTGCGSQTTEAPAKEKSEEVKIKLGVTGTDHEVWDFVKEKLAQENIDLEIVSFSDYVRPNIALAEGEIDANAFQTIAYFENFKEDHNLNLVSIGNTLLALMAIYSNKIDSLDRLKDGAKVALPNDATNSGRALILLEEAGFIKLREGAGLLPTVKDVTENPKGLELIELVATQIPRSLDDVDIAVINNGVAVQAGFSPTRDSLFIEDVESENAKPYINIIVVRDEDRDRRELKRIVEVYQNKETLEVIDKIYQGDVIPAF